MAKARARRTFLIAAALVAVLGGLVFNEYQRDIQRARERVATSSRIAETRCGPIEYAAAGNGPPVLVVHGAGGGFDQGMLFAQPLIERGFRAIAMSRFGYLRTPLPGDASASAQADAHACLLDALDIKRAAIVGASAGAPSSVQFALRHPQRTTALVLLVPALYAPRPAGAPSLETPAGVEFIFNTVLKSDFLMWAAIRLARPTLIRSILATPLEVMANASAAERARVHRMLDFVLPVSPRRLGLLNDAAITSSLPRYDLEKITTPTLAISAADDLFGTFIAARHTAEHVPRARFVGYPSGGHLWVGHQEDVMSRIAAFLK